MNLLDSYKQINETCSFSENPTESLELSADIARQHLSKFKSNFKRNKYFSSLEGFVLPTEKAIGTRWELKKVKIASRTVRIPRLIQCVMQYVSIIQTLRSLFLNKEFADMYLKYNQIDRSNTIGRDGTKSFTCFNSGSVFAKSDFFTLNPNCLQIQIGVDDFEICNPLQSKANHHKICAVYFSIHNVPPQFQSKLNNIYLVCLCNTDDLKSKQTDPNNIWQLIVDEISELEDKGIDYGEINIKGTLIHTIFDNLGANVGLGFSGSFSSTKYCRFCLCTKTECQHITRESECILRNIQNYEESLETIADSEQVNYNDSNGVKFYCVLSDLKYFHIVQNASVDAMHDINEGCIPKFLCEFFKSCFKMKIFSSDEIENLVKYYDYGSLSTADIPSRIDFDKRSLGQNASQSLCLFRHLPFILHKWKDHPKLKETWACYQALLFICEIAYSYEITELDVKKLEVAINLHFDLFQKIFKIHLSPKHHFLLHYPNIIRAIGPLVFYNMMRFDSKHRVFKIIRSVTNNFKAINKTLAHVHQKQMYLSGFSNKDDIEWGLLKSFEKESLIDSELLNEFIDVLMPVYETKYLLLNHYKYMPAIMIIHDGFFHEIIHIICICDEFYFVCKRYLMMEFDPFYNSFHVEKEESSKLTLIKFKDLLHFKSYELKSVNTNSYIISSNRDMYKHIS